eukprot:6208125-Pleurochrysis_carterae.AAC.5
MEQLNREHCCRRRSESARDASTCPTCWCERRARLASPGRKDRNVHLAQMNMTFDRIVHLDRATVAFVVLLTRSSASSNTSADSPYFFRNAAASASERLSYEASYGLGAVQLMLSKICILEGRERTFRRHEGPCIRAAASVGWQRRRVGARPQSSLPELR